VIQKKIFKRNNIQDIHLDKKILKKLSKDFEKIFKEIKHDSESEKNTLNVLSNKFKFNFNFKDLKKFKKFKSIAIIGMGGSILGIEAISGFLEKKLNKKIYFFDNINFNKNLNFIKKEKLIKTLFLVISKSGNTIETLSNFLSLNIIKKNSKNIIIISEKKNNYLYLISKKFNLFFIEHKNNIGGRYSVLSEVGIVPAYLMGLNIIKLRKNIKKCISVKEKIFLKSSTIKFANLMLKKKYSNLIFLNYVPELEKFLYWCQQLIAESLGKKEKGFLPVVSSAPKDHHSLLQIYLDGPKNNIFNIFSIHENVKQKIKTNNIMKKIKFLNNKTLYDVKTAQKKALIKSFDKNNIPYREFQIKTLNEETLGELFAYFIFETVIIAKLMNINPYDQPAVEQVKAFTKKMLK
jgi:glucose-6-phosphate isomerase|tara:strand:+ start:3702 stop:4919 length:1218 start_codon:yes stop_codon:yes gene_type:complete